MLISPTWEDIERHCHEIKGVQASTVYDAARKRIKELEEELEAMTTEAAESQNELERIETALRERLQDVVDDQVGPDLINVDDIVDSVLR